MGKKNPSAVYFETTQSYSTSRCAGKPYALRAVAWVSMSPLQSGLPPSEMSLPHIAYSGLLAPAPLEKPILQEEPDLGQESWRVVGAAPCWPHREATQLSTFWVCSMHQRTFTTPSERVVGVLELFMWQKLHF